MPTGRAEKEAGGSTMAAEKGRDAPSPGRESVRSSAGETKAAKGETLVRMKVARAP